MDKEIKPTNEELKLTIIDDSIIYLNDRIENFDIQLLVFLVSDVVQFINKISYSFDNQNWSNPIDLSQLENITDFNELLKIDSNSNYVPSVYISIWLTKYEKNEPNDTLYIKKNVDDTIQKITIEKIEYNSKPIEYRVSTFKTLINQYPKWNLYDKQFITIQNWLKQCVSISKSYGFQCIYFKTEAADVHHTIASTDTRKVVSIKKIFVNFPGNELPQDRNVYSEWDYALEGDSVMHIVDSNFKIAFGDISVPLQKDYFYLPILNKLFKISTVQAGKQFMGVTGWWEVYISKYEEDETITMSDSMKNSISGFEDFDVIENMIEELDIFKEETVITKEKLLEETIDEKKEITQNFSNRLTDSTRFIDLKETELQREFFDKRLAIVSINPDNNAFPVTMYDCSTVTKNTVGLTYNLIDNVSINKKTLLLENELKFNFNYILQSKYSGEIIDILGDGDLSFLTIESKRNKIQIKNHSNQITINIDYEFIPLEFYQINIKFNKTLGQIAVTIFILKNTQKKLEFQNIYINQSNINNKINFKNIYLYGGNFFIGDLFFFIDNNKILSDYVNPILNMNKFGK